jgi:predicted nucleic acid-binding protein
MSAVETVCMSVLGRIEFERVVRRFVEDADELVESVLSGIEILPLHVAGASIAAAVPPSSLKTLDAIHLAAVLEVRDDIDEFWCYDERLAAAAREHGITVVAPH